MDLLLILSGLILAFVTKNKRWMILTAIGLLWFVVDVLLIAASMVK